MSSSSRYWPRVGKTAFMLSMLYLIGMSFWCSAAGKAYKQHVLDQDRQFHAASEGLEATRLRLQGQGERDIASHPEFVAAGAKVSELIKAHDEGKHKEFTGLDAMRWTAIIGVGWLALYFGIAAVVWKLRKSTIGEAQSSPAG